MIKRMSKKGFNEFIETLEWLIALEPEMKEQLLCEGLYEKREVIR